MKLLYVHTNAKPGHGIDSNPAATAKFVFVFIQSGTEEEDKFGVVEARIALFTSRYM